MSPKMSPKKIRRAAGLSLEKVAARANVSGPTARIYELDPQAIRDERKRASLAREYASLAGSLHADGGSAA